MVWLGIVPGCMLSSLFYGPPRVSVSYRMSVYKSISIKEKSLVCSNKRYRRMVLKE